MVDVRVFAVPLRTVLCTVVSVLVAVPLALSAGPAQADPPGAEGEADWAVAADPPSAVRDSKRATVTIAGTEPDKLLHRKGRFRLTK